MGERIMRRLKNEAGTALVVTGGLLFLITLLGLATFRWSVDEIGIAGNQKASIQSRYIAESGAALMLQWFQEPQTFPEIGIFPQREPAEGRARFLAKRMTDPDGAPSYLNDSGQSQFLGTAEEPDFLYESEQGDTELLGEAFAGLGTLTRLKLFGPTTIGAVGTVEATGTTGYGIGRTVSIEIVPIPIPTATAAVQIEPGYYQGLPVIAVLKGSWYLK